MAFRKLLIAVDSGPIAAHAVDIGVELARALNAEVAFINAIDPALGYAADSGIPAGELISLAKEKEEGKKLFAAFRARAPDHSLGVHAGWWLGHGDRQGR